jgi:hypothetical protein
VTAIITVPFDELDGSPRIKWERNRGSAEQDFLIDWTDIAQFLSDVLPASCLDGTELIVPPAYAFGAFSQLYAKSVDIMPCAPDRSSRPVCRRPPTRSPRRRSALRAQSSTRRRPRPTTDRSVRRSRRVEVRAVSGSPGQIGSTGEYVYMVPSGIYDLGNFANLFVSGLGAS